MKIIAMIILSILIKPSFGQEIISKMKLKPISQLSYLSTNENAKIEREQQNKKRIDSLNNSDDCKKKLEEYKTISKKNTEKIIATKKIVEDLNKENKNSGYYYYIVYECNPNVLDFKECGGITIINSADICIDFELKIEKKEKSRLILDGPTGEVFYYEDIKLIPR
ncbi:MAG: hypothetical protein HGB12_05730 [Bacteroidetes bacterium]|nr:hypothetical protein [Bacteroidota bacterium]